MLQNFKTCENSTFCDLEDIKNKYRYHGQITTTAITKVIKKTPNFPYVIVKNGRAKNDWCQ